MSHAASQQRSGICQMQPHENPSISNYTNRKFHDLGSAHAQLMGMEPDMPPNAPMPAMGGKDVAPQRQEHEQTPLD